jgi:adenosine/AMP deaminase
MRRRDKIKKKVAGYLIDKIFDGSMLGKPTLCDGFNSKWLNCDDSHYLANMMINSGFGLGGDTFSAVKELIKDYDGQMIRMLSLYNTISSDSNPIMATNALISTQLFAKKEVVTGLTTISEDMEVCDSHLHGGLAANIYLLNLFLIDQRIEPIGVVKVGPQYWKCGLIEIDMPLALSILRWATWVFEDLVDSNWSYSEFLNTYSGRTVFEWIRNNTFWSKVCIVTYKSSTHAVTHYGERIDIYNLLSTLDVRKPERNYSLPDNLLYRTIKQNPSWMSNFDSWQSQYIIGLIRFSTSIFSAGIARDGDGLSEFQSRVDYAIKLKKIILQERSNSKLLFDVKKQHVYYEVLKVLKTSFKKPYRFGGCEFRQNLHDALGENREVTKVMNEITDSIFPAWRAFEKFAEEVEKNEPGTQIRLCTPLSFQRIPSQGHGEYNDPNMQQPGAEFKEAVITANAILCFRELLKPHTFRQVVGSVDVSGVESWSQNWPYVSVMNWLRKSTGNDLLISLHAGESFAYRMRGLRMIGECFLGDFPPDRIGHALALSSRFSHKIETINSWPPIPRRELLADLCWIHRLLRHNDNDDCFKFIEQLTRAHNSLLSIDPSAWVEAFHLLHKASLVDKIVERVKPIMGAKWSNIMADKVCWRTSQTKWCDSQVFAGAYLFAWNTCDNFNTVECALDNQVPQELEERIKYYMENYLDDVEEAIKSLMRTHGTIIEVCPTSNLRLAGISGYFNHPVWEWIRDGLTVSINSDDPLIFAAYAGDELLNLSNDSTQPNIKNLKTMLRSLRMLGHCQGVPLGFNDIKDIVQELSRYVSEK